MLFRKKYDRALELMEEKNRAYLESMTERGDSAMEIEAEELAEAERKAREFHEGEKLELEKGDLPAMILSALLVFGPIILVLCGILAVAWIYLH